MNREFFNVDNIDDIINVINNVIIKVNYNNYDDIFKKHIKNKNIIKENYITRYIINIQNKIK